MDERRQAVGDQVFVLRLEDEARPQHRSFVAAEMLDIRLSVLDRIGRSRAVAGRLPG